MKYNQNNPHMINSNTTQAMKTLGLSMIVVANIFLFVPVTIYIGNQDEFFTSLWNIMKLVSIPAFAMMALLVVVGNMQSKENYQRYTAVMASVGLVIWMQGSLLVWNYGFLDGSNINWNESSWRGVIDLTIWILFISSAVFFRSFTGKIYIQLVTVIFVLQSVILISSVYNNFDNLNSKDKPYASPEALHEMYRLSSVQNVVHIILDSFQADIFEEIVTSNPRGEIYQSSLEGFTFYKEHTGGYPYTYFAMPAIISGELYKNEVPKAQFNERVYKGNTILNAAYAAGYEIDIANDVLMLDKLTKGKHTNAYLISSNVHIGNKMHSFIESAKLLDLAFFRIAPHFLKPYVYNKQRWLLQNIFSGEEYWNFFYFSHNAFLHSLTQNMTVDREAPVYKFIHLMSPHAPMVVDENCEYRGSLLRNRETVKDQSRCTLDFVISFLEKMKEKDIYDNSIIILMADHGGHISPPRFNPDEINKSMGHTLNPWVVAMATPLMLIKPQNTTGPLEFSSAPTSMLDIAATVSSLLNLEANFPGRSILDISPAEQRERRFYFYPWRIKDNDLDYTLPIQELIINGNPYETASWSKGKEFTPPEGY